MNLDCRKIRYALLDMAYAGSDTHTDNGSLNGSAGRLRGLETLDGNVSAADVANHVENCRECRDYANALACIASLLPTSHGKTSSEGVEDCAAMGPEIEWVEPDWSRLNATIERGIQMRVARERQSTALFALAATGILAAVWVPLLASNPVALLKFQAMGLLGIALF